jgi:hypothetical protein
MSVSGDVEIVARVETSASADILCKSLTIKSKRQALLGSICP